MMLPDNALHNSTREQTLLCRIDSDKYREQGRQYIRMRCAGCAALTVPDENAGRPGQATSVSATDFACQSRLQNSPETRSESLQQTGWLQSCQCQNRLIPFKILHNQLQQLSTMHGLDDYIIEADSRAGLADGSTHGLRHGDNRHMRQ